MRRVPCLLLVLAPVVTLGACNGGEDPAVPDAGVEPPPPPAVTASTCAKDGSILADVGAPGWEAVTDGRALFFASQDHGVTRVDLADGTLHAIDDRGEGYYTDLSLAGDHVYYAFRAGYGDVVEQVRVSTAPGAAREPLAGPYLGHVAHDGASLYSYREVADGVWELFRDDRSLVRRPATPYVVDDAAIWAAADDEDPANGLLVRIDKDTGEEATIATVGWAQWSATHAFQDDDWVYLVLDVRFDDVVVRVAKATGTTVELARNPQDDYAWKVIGHDAHSIYVLEQENWGDCGDGDGPVSCGCGARETSVKRIGKRDGGVSLVEHFTADLTGGAVLADCLYLVDPGPVWQCPDGFPVRIVAK